MRILVTYDVATTTRPGRRRLRRVARVCCDYGQRVQYSVFECVVGEVEMVLLRERLLKEIEPSEDSLRIYRLPGELCETVEHYGLDRGFDFEEPLIV